MPSTHIWPCGNKAHNPIRKAQHLHLINQWSKKGLTLTLGHARNQSSMPKGSCTYIWSNNDQRKAQNLHLAMWGTNPPCQKAPALISDQPMIEERHNTYIWSTHDRRKAQHLYLINTWSNKGSALTSTQEGTHPAHNYGRACTHIWSCRNQSYSHIRMAPSPPWLSYLVTDQVPSFS